jgi:hypothetical protein
MRTAFPVIITRDVANFGVEVITQVLRRREWWGSPRLAKRVLQDVAGPYGFWRAALQGAV